MLFFYLFLIPQVISTLKRGDDPYKILGVRRDASEAEIKKAYRQITKKYHPDVAKIDKKEAEKIFIRATDAYELLTDEKRKRLFDQTGSVSEEPEVDQQSGYQQYYQWPGGFGNFHNTFFYHNFNNYDFKTDEVTTSNVDKVLKKNKELFVFVYNGNDMRTPQYAKFFEEVSDELGKLAKLVRNNAANSERFALNYGVRSLPSFIHLKIQEDGTIKSSVETSIDSRTSLINWIEKCWETNFKYFSNAKKLQKWIENNQDFTRVVSVERGNEPSMEFKKASAQYKNCLFAVVIDDYINVIRYLKLTELPSTLIFRSNKKLKLRSFSELKTYSNPFFAKLERYSLDRECSQFCLLLIGKPTEETRSNFSDFTEAPLMWISQSSKFAQSLKMKNGNWILLSGKQKKYARINIDQKYSEITKFHAKRLSMHSLKCEVDWSFKTYCEKAKDSILSTLSFLNPVNYLINLVSIGSSFLMPFIMMLFPIFVLSLFARVV